MKITENRAFELIQLGNKLKDQGELGLANFVCALILYQDGGFLEGVKVEVETQDPNGDDIFESFYDLVKISVREESLRIPFPILCKSVGAALIKRGHSIDRYQSGTNRKLGKKESWMTPEEILTLVPELVEDPSLCKKAWECIVDAESAILTAHSLKRPDDAESIQRMVDYFESIPEGDE